MSVESIHQDDPPTQPAEPLLDIAERLSERIDALLVDYRDAVNLLRGALGLIEIITRPEDPVRLNHRYVDAVAWLEKRERA